MSTPSGRPDVSVVICTYNRKARLRECLTSILAVDCPQESYEVIVVDGGSDDGTIDLREEFTGILFVEENGMGLASARNQGAQLARGRIIAYTDDDCVVDKEWLRKLLEAFAISDSIVGVGGPVFPLHGELIPRQLMVKAALGLYDEGDEIKSVGILIGSNSAFKREIFEKFKFDENLRVTRKGNSLLCGEDTDFCRTITSSDCKLLYTPFAKVYHQVKSERIRVLYIMKHAANYGLFVTRSYLKKKKSRVWLVRFALGRFIQNLASAILNRSFDSCYNLIYSISTLTICITGMDLVLLKN